MYITLSNGLLGECIGKHAGDNPLCLILVFAPIAIFFLTMLYAKRKSTIVTVGALLVAVFGANLILAHLILTSIVLLYSYKEENK